MSLRRPGLHGGTVRGDATQLFVWGSRVEAAHQLLQADPDIPVETKRCLTHLFEPRS